jgi:hypothetical protein
VERWFGPLEQAVLGLAEAKDRMSRVESDVAGLRAVMADGSAKVEEVRREVAGLKAAFSDWRAKVKTYPSLNAFLTRSTVQKQKVATPRFLTGRWVRSKK